MEIPGLKPVARLAMARLCDGGVSIPSDLFADILRHIDRIRPRRDSVSHGMVHRQPQKESWLQVGRFRVRIVAPEAFTRETSTVSVV
jgi:hypothetical protein